MTAPDVRDAARATFLQALAWLDDPSSAFELRSFARDLVYPTMKRIADERSVTYLLAAVHRGIDRGDMLAVKLVYEVPLWLDDGREPRGPGLTRLGEHALAVGALEPLFEITRASVLTRRMVVPPEWMRAILEAESGPEPRDDVVDLLADWLESESSEVAAIVEVLERRPLVHAKLYCPPEIPF